MIREVQITDAPAIKALCRDALGYDADLDLVRQQIGKLCRDPKHHSFVYLDPSTQALLGYVEVEVYDCFYSPTGLNVLGLAVLEDAQGQGIGKQLMTFLEAWARDHAYPFIRLNSALHREDAHAFYQKLGYDGQKLQKRFIKELSVND